MAYIFKGTILGALCSDCIEPLAGLKLRFYRLASDRNVTALAVAAPKDTFTLLDDAAVEARRSLLLGEAEIDERGNFSFEFAKGYDGGPFEVDLYCGTVPRLKPGPRPPQPLQFTITTLQPPWRPMGQDSVAAWEYTVPYRYWCHIRGRFGAWTICGHVIHCETKAPIGGVQRARLRRRLAAAGCAGPGRDRRHRPFPHRLLGRRLPEDDLLAVDQHRTDRRSRPLFQGRDAQRHGAAGRAAVARAVGRPRECRSVLLRRPLPREAASDPVEYLPVFDALGGYLYASDIHSTVPGSGLTNGDNRAFYSTVRLNGLLPKTLNGQPMEYRFEFRPTDAVGQLGRAVDAGHAGPVRQHRARQAGALCAGVPGRSEPDQDGLGLRRPGGSRRRPRQRRDRRAAGSACRRPATCSGPKASSCPTATC